MSFVSWDPGSGLHPDCVESWTPATTWLLLPPTVCHCYKNITENISNAVPHVLGLLSTSFKDQYKWQWLLVSFYSFASGWETWQNSALYLWKKEEGLQWEAEIATSIWKWLDIKLCFVTSQGCSKMKICPLGSRSIHKKYGLDLWAVSLVVDITPHRIQLQCYKKNSMRGTFLIKIFTSGYHRNDGQKKDCAKTLDTTTISIRTTLAISVFKKPEDTWKFYSWV